MKNQNAAAIALPETFGDLCWDNYGKTSAIVFGNIDDHAAQLEALGGVRRMANYSVASASLYRRPGKNDRMEAFYFDKSHAQNAGQYVARVNHTIMDGIFGSPDHKTAEEYREGDRVRTIYGPGHIIDGTSMHKPCKGCLWVELDGMTYNYGPKGFPHKFVEVSAEYIIPEVTPRYSGHETSPNLQASEVKPARHSITASERQAYADYYKQRISDSAACGFVQAFQWKAYRVEVHIDSRNDTDDPEGMTYRVIWFDDQKPQKTEGCVTLEQAARHMADFCLLCQIGLTLSDILSTGKWEVVA